MKLSMQVGLGSGHIVLDGTQLPSPKGAQPPISAHICCGQMAAWIKMLLGMEIGVVPGDFMLHGDPAPSPNRGRSPPPDFRPIFIGAKRLDGSRWY